MPGTTPDTGGQVDTPGAGDGGAVTPAPTPTQPISRHRARNSAFAFGSDPFNYLGISTKSRLTEEVYYSNLTRNGKAEWGLHNQQAPAIYFRLIYIVNEGVGSVTYRVTTGGKVHATNGAFGTDGLWRYVYDVYLPPRTDQEIQSRTHNSFRLTVTPSGRPVSALVQWHLVSSAADSKNYPYPSPIDTAEDELEYPYLNSRLDERDDEESSFGLTLPMSPGRYKLVADVGNGFVYTLYHQLVNKYADLSGVIEWTVGYYPDTDMMTLYQATPNGDGYLDVTGANPGWSDTSRVMTIVPVGRLFAVGWAGQYLASSVTGFSSGAYAGSIATYDTTYVSDPAMALLFDFVAVY